MMRQAMILCEEARTSRRVWTRSSEAHKKTGEIVSKTKLISKPE